MKISFGAYAEQWITGSVIKPTMEDLYRRLLKNHFAPAVGNRSLTGIREADVRRWRKDRLAMVGPSTQALGEARRVARGGQADETSGA
ncbi:hypothetical protein [Nonomuraea bangladeshensis]|uniref:hypothetical protein n=1 Tax=Nonomuraea bangladeshensis TaxID=404385 RepID=UPI0031DB2D51